MFVAACDGGSAICDADKRLTQNARGGSKDRTAMALKLSDRWLNDLVSLVKKGVELDAEAEGGPGRTSWDSEITGFGLRWLKPTDRNRIGGRSFFMNYRIDGREKRFTIGAHPDWTVEAARAEAKALRRRIDRGEDPAKDRRERREAPTVRDLAERYREEHLSKKAASSQKNDWAMIQREILPALSDRKVADVHIGDIEALHRGITKRGTPVRANRVVAVASAMFSISVKRAEGETEPWRNQLQGNPCKGVGRNPEEGRERFFSPAELAALGDALVAPGDKGPTPAADCIRFVMLTGCRPGEAMHAKWEQFETEPGFWVKPSAHTKQRKTHRVPLGAAAVELIERIKVEREKTPRRAQSEYAFPGQFHGEPLKQLRSTWEEVAGKASVALWRDAKDPRVAALVAELERSLGREATATAITALAAKAGVKLPPAPQDARIYDLRHTFASIGAGGGLSLPIIGRLLGHTQMRTTQRYAHLADDPLKDAAAKITATIAGAGKDNDKVTRFPKRGA
jgi:integrase